MLGFLIGTVYGLVLTLLLWVPPVVKPGVCQVMEVKCKKHNAKTLCRVDGRNCGEAESKG